MWLLRIQMTSFACGLCMHAVIVEAV